MPTRKAEAEWKGNLAEGSGRLRVGSGAFDGPYSFKSRFEEGQAASVLGRLRPAQQISPNQPTGEPDPDPASRHGRLGHRLRHQIVEGPV